MAACAAAGVGLGSAEVGSEVDSWVSRKRSGGRRAQRVLICEVEVRESSQGIVVLVGRRSGRVVEGCCCCCPCGLEALRDWRKFWTRAEVSWGLGDEESWLAYLLSKGVRKRAG